MACRAGWSGSLGSRNAMDPLLCIRCGPGSSPCAWPLASLFPHLSHSGFIMAAVRFPAYLSKVRRPREEASKGIEDQYTGGQCRGASGKQRESLRGTKNPTCSSSPEIRISVAPCQFRVSLVNEGYLASWLCDHSYLLTCKIGIKFYKLKKKKILQSFPNCRMLITGDLGWL